MIMIIIFIVAVIAIAYVLCLYNGFVKQNNKVMEAFSTMDVYLKKRWDLVPNIVETVKGYAKHEKDTFKEVIEMRNGAYDNMSVDEKIHANGELSKRINTIMALAEDYPELKSNENFLRLQNDLMGIEDEISNARKYYNAVVRDYNDKVGIVPNCFFAKLFGFSAKSMFEANENERENVKVEF